MKKRKIIVSISIIQAHNPSIHPSISLFLSISTHYPLFLSIHLSYSHFQNIPWLWRLQRKRRTFYYALQIDLIASGFLPCHPKMFPFKNCPSRTFIGHRKKKMATRVKWLCPFHKLESTKKPHLS